MEKLRNISHKKQWLAISLGIVLGIFVLGSSMCVQIPKDITEQLDSNTPETVVEMTIEAVPSAVQPAVERTSYLIETLPKNEEPASEEVTQESFLPSPAKIFKILSEHIISPNSP